jgi:acyl transferase domain-containing protein
MALGVAVASVLKHFGVEPAVVLGHSLGEFTAAVLSGAISAADAIRFVTLRGQAMNALAGDHGTMAAVMAPAAQIAAFVEGEVVLANFNHPTQTVISGPCKAVESTIKTLITAGFKVHHLKVSHAFHAPLMAAIQPQVQQLLSQIKLSAPQLHFASCIAEAAPQTAEAVQAIFVQHATAPVHYMRGLRQCQAAGAKIYLQLTPGRTLSSFAKGSIEDAAAILSVGEGIEGLMRVLATLYVYGHPVELSGLGEGLALLPPAPRSTCLLYTSPSPRDIP